MRFKVEILDQFKAVRKDRGPGSAESGVMVEVWKADVPQIAGRPRRPLPRQVGDSALYPTFTDSAVRAVAQPGEVGDRRGTLTLAVLEKRRDTAGR